MFGWFKCRQPPSRWSLDKPLFAWNRQDDFSIRDACSGVAVFGATGSGKTSGSGRLLATSYLKAGFGFLVLCTKSDERDLWLRYCQETGRGEDVVVFSPENRYRFNALDHECRHGGRGGGLTPNIVNLIEEVLEMANGREKGAGGKGEDAYWLTARKQLLWNAVDLLVLSDDVISIPNVYQVIASAPHSPQQLGSRDWQNSSYCFHRMLVMLHRGQEGQIDERQRFDAAKVAHFFQREHLQLAEKTRSIVDSTFCAAASILDRGVLRELFSTTSNVSPSDVLNGKIVVVDLPVENFGVAGLFAGILWKKSVQLSLLRRAVGPGTRPVSIFADEAQNFITGADASFLSTCRSKLAANVYLSQNINNYIAALGAGDKATAEVESVLGNAGTLIAHANSCQRTGEYMSERIGRERQFLSNFSQSGGANDWYSAMGGEGEQNETAGFSETWEYQLQPSFYGTLRTGGQRHNRMVDAIVYTTGHEFKSSRRNWMTTTLRQAD
ncbi:MAG: TraM recognition domain-containing protein [Burkholderiales bacterium]|nr:TraM recognition domain-containing protein [Phycisphaerae bacterium]